MISRLDRLIRFFLFFSLLTIRLKVRGSFFQSAFENLLFFNQALIRALDGQSNASNSDIDYTRTNYEDVKQEDDDFSVVINQKNGAVLIPETTYEEIITEIKDLRRKILDVGKSDTQKFELLQKIYDFYDDPTGRYSHPWKEHVTTLRLIIRERRVDGIYIPNSILTAYLRYFKTKILLATSLSDTEICERAMPLILEMTRSAARPEFIDVLLSTVANNLGNRQIYNLFEACHLMFRSFTQTLHTIPESKRPYAVYRISTNYLLLLKYFNLDQKALENLRAKIPTSAIFMPFFQIVIPYYRILLLLPRRFEALYFPAISFDGPYFIEICRWLDFFIKYTDFNNNFMLSNELIILKMHIFQKLKAAFFRNIPLKNVMIFCMDFDLRNLLEALSIFSAKDAQFNETFIELLRIALREPNIKLPAYAGLLAFCPEITIDLFDKLILEWSLEPKSKIRFDSLIVKGIRRLILATERIEKSEFWDMTPRFLELIETDDLDPTDSDLLQAARIYLFRLYGIPFNRTMIIEDSAEDVTWTEMIAFVNLILEREFKAKNIDQFLRLQTHHKNY